MNRATRFRGQPVLLLAAVCAGWIGLRVALAGGDEGAGALAEPPLPETTVFASVKRPSDGDVSVVSGVAAFGGSNRSDAGITSFLLSSAGAASLPMAEHLQSKGRAERLPQQSVNMVPMPPAQGDSADLGGPPVLSSSMQAVVGFAQPNPSLHPSALPTELAPVVNRWSGDGWVLLRDDAGAALNPGRPSYGRSQAGAVIRYRLDRGDRRSAQAYARVSRALAGKREADVAVGLSARPMGAVPVRLAAELRVTEGASDTKVRPSAFAVSEFAPVTLPLGAQAEAYVQAGYVAGPNATAFADGQLRADKAMAQAGPVETRLGVGVWGGAQRGSERLDIGPSLTARTAIGPVFARLAADYRFRIAGTAEPSSGPSLTLSAGF